LVKSIAPMGYGIFSFGIVPERIVAALGSKDPDLFQQVQSTKYFDLYSSQDRYREDHLTTRDALEQLIWGKPINKKSIHRYWYAFIALCDWLGEKMPATHEINLLHEVPNINSYLASDFGIKTEIGYVLLTGPDPFDIPPPDDWPMVGLLNRDALSDLAIKFSGIDISQELVDALWEEDEEKAEAYDSIRQIKCNVAYCLEKNLELISFCH
jgi:hypothetical protein